MLAACHPAFAALPSAHPARAVDDELRWGPISMRVCTTCFAPSGLREVWDAALFFCGDRFLLARPMPSSSPMACIAHVRGLGSHSCFARPYHAARGLGSQALRQPRLRTVVVLVCPRRALAPRLPRPPELRGACGRAACAPRRSTRRRLPSVTAEPRVPPPNSQVSVRAKACKARRTR
jgi:hypothetical protein